MKRPLEELICGSKYDILRDCAVHLAGITPTSALQSAVSSLY